MAAKVVLVTGATRGIGRKTVEKLLLDYPEFTVVLTARSEEAGQAAFREISALGDFTGRFAFHQLDILSEESIGQLKSWIEATYGGLDVLCNNAGIAFKGNDFNEEVVRTTLGTNFFATVRVTEVLLPIMKPGGHIVMVSSMMGKLSRIPGTELKQALIADTLTVQGVFDIAERYIQSVIAGTFEQEGWPRNSYIASKNLLNAYIRAKTREVAGRVRINGLCPGWVKTDMGGPNALLTLEEGVVTPLTVISYTGAETGKFWSNGKIDTWE